MSMDTLYVGIAVTNVLPISSSPITSKSYDVVFVAGVDLILQRFKDFKSRVVFSAEGFCWPDQSLAVRDRWGVMKDGRVSRFGLSIFAIKFTF